MILFILLCLATVIFIPLGIIMICVGHYRWMTTILSIAILWGFTFIACLERINPGEVGVVVNLLGSEKGVEEKELKVGYHLITPWQKIYRFPIFDQNHQWTESEGFSFQTQEGLSVHADIGISFNLLPAKVHELFCKYRRGMQEITDLFIRNNVRDAINRHASKMKIEDLYGQKKEEFFNEILSDLHKELQPLGFNISHIYIIGRFGVPDNVKEALNRKIEATQRAQQRENELREAEAEAKKQIAFTEGSARSAMITAKATADALLLEAKAQAEANRMLSQSLTREVIEYQATLKWNGILPSAMSGEQMPFLLSVGGRK